jgi:hypothetical protein
MIYQNNKPITDDKILSWGNVKITPVKFDNNIKQHKQCDKNVTIVKVYQ